MLWNTDQKCKKCDPTKPRTTQRQLLYAHCSIGTCYGTWSLCTASKQAYWHQANLALERKIILIIVNVL